MAKIDDILYELNALNTGFTKVASRSKSSRLASSLDKLASELEAEDEEAEEEDEENEDEEKEGSYKVKKADKVQKVASRQKPTAQQWANAFRKTAVLSREDTQGSTVSEGAKPGDGAATNAARETDNIISYDSVESQAESNPQRHYDSETADLVEDEAPNSEALVEKLKEGSLHLYTREESEALQKLASYGYHAYIEARSDELVQQKIAQLVQEKKAGLALNSIADQYIDQEIKTAAYNQSYNDLLTLKQVNPQAFYQLKQAALEGRF